MPWIRKSEVQRKETHCKKFFRNGNLSAGLSATRNKTASETDKLATVVSF